MIKKKAVSLVVSYVILVSIVIGLSITVYSILKTEANRVKPAIDCEDGTSLIVLNAENNNNKFEITLKNNGYFNISGVIVHYSINKDDYPTELLELKAGNAGYSDQGTGYYLFEEPLAPGQEKTISYDYSNNNIQRIRVQPFIVNENKRITVCSEAIIDTNI